MRKQMILAVFIISVALGTEPEFQSRIILLRPAADGTFMLCDLGIGIPLYVLFKFHFAPDLLGI